MTKTIGFIGAGKMAQAMIAGMLKSKLIAPDKIIASALTETTLEAVKHQFSIHTTDSNREVTQFADILILAVKPDLHSSVINEIKDAVKPDVIIVTIAAGITLHQIEEAFEQKIKAVRTMPNTPALAGEGMSALALNEFITDTDKQEIEQIFNTFGKAEWLEEKLMDAVPAISGSSPAYVYMFIEAMADGGVRQGIPRDQAYRFAAQAVLGAAKMVLETGLHPGELKDQVCTPGGVTIEAVASLEANNFRGAILAAMESCTKKSKSL